MLTRRKIISAIMVIAVLIATWAMLGTAVAQKAAVPKPQDKLAITQAEVEQLLLLMEDKLRSSSASFGKDGKT